MFNVDPVFNRPDFVVTVSGGSPEENAQMATAIGHAMNLCGFSNASIDPSQNTVPDYTNSAEVLNSLRMLNPDLFESCTQVTTSPTESAMTSPAMLGMVGGFAPQVWSSF